MVGRAAGLCLTGADSFSGLNAGEYFSLAAVDFKYHAWLVPRKVNPNQAEVVFLNGEVAFLLFNHSIAQWGISQARVFLRILLKR